MECVTALEDEQRTVARAWPEPRGRYRLLRQRCLRCVQLAHPSRQPGNILRRMPPQPDDPDLSQYGTTSSTGRRSKLAKHRLFYTLLRLRLPLRPKPKNPDGLDVRFSAGARQFCALACTGVDRSCERRDHAQSCGSRRRQARAAQRHAMGEPYRTLLGHFRHEIRPLFLGSAGRAIRQASRNIAGSSAMSAETTDRRCSSIMPSGRANDWADHLRDVLCQFASVGGFRRNMGALFSYRRYARDRQAPSACGSGPRVRPQCRFRRSRSTSIRMPRRSTRSSTAWLPLTFAMNSINRSMGLQDLYPFCAPARGDRETCRSCMTSFTRRIGNCTKPRPDRTLQAIVAGFQAQDRRDRSRLRNARRRCEARHSYADCAGGPELAPK